MPEAAKVYVRTDDTSKRIALETNEGVYFFQPDEALEMVRAIMKCIIQQGYKPAVIMNDEGQYIDLELL